MFVILIMLAILIEVIFAGFLIFNLAKLSGSVRKITKEIIEAKNQIIPILLEVRVGLRMANIQAKNLKIDQSNKQLFDVVNILGVVSILFGGKKRKYCK